MSRPITMKLPLRTLGLGSLLAFALPASAIDLFGVTDFGNRLVSFDSATPGTLSRNVGLTGLSANDFLVGLDFRSATNALYGLGRSGNLYTIDTATGAATIASTLSVALTGTSFGVDFNPTVDRLRIVSSSGQNLRVNVDTGVATVDGALNFATGGGTPNIAAVAYTNAFAGATTTTLYDLDATRNEVYIQNPPNAGTLVFNSAVGQDIVSGATDLDFAYENGVNTGYAVFNLPGQAQTSLFTFNPTSNAFTSAGLLPAGLNVTLVAAQPVPEPASLAALAVGALALVRRRRKA